MQSPNDDSTAYVLTLEEIENLVHEGGKPVETLTNVVALIANRFHADVCSAYLLEPDRAHLVLAATLGLQRECVGTLRMSLKEGLAGLVAESLRPVAVEQASQHPRFKYFPEAGEDACQSFLGVPLIDRGVLQGVIVLQTSTPRTFDDAEIQLSITHNLPSREEPGMEIVQFPKAAPDNDVTRRRVVVPCEISAEFCHFSQIVLHG